MKTLLTSLFLICIVGTTSAQESPELFAQCLFTIESEEAMQQLELELKEIDFTSIVRLDWNTQRAFMLISNLDELSEEDFISWFGEYSETVTCVQIGVHGLEEIHSYPFTNCEN